MIDLLLTLRHMKRHSSPKGRRPARSALQRIPAAAWIRLGCIAVLWLLLCWLLIATRPLTLWVLFVIAASGIVVFVPLYKKYVKNAKD